MNTIKYQIKGIPDFNVGPDSLNGVSLFTELILSVYPRLFFWL